ncbi:PASTA domain-containing protein [Mycobacterium sp. 48b]|uniref:PASTA domain-containing protein n=1 Tax=Mycobacterium sp. 48b TaxID=3400426 RepID=UPI003AB0F684
MAFFVVVAWPYLLGTYIAVQCGAWNPSTERFAVGWLFEVIYIAALVGWVVLARASHGRRAAIKAHQFAVLRASGAVYETQSGRSVVYRHGTCTVNHRSAETAARCTRSTHETLPQIADAQSAPEAVATLERGAIGVAVRWSAGVLVVGLAVGLAVLVADPIHSAAGDARSKPCPSLITVGASPHVVSMPDLVGQNAGGVEAQLKRLGLNNVELSSANPEYKSVWVASNWTVVSTDPAPGCDINAVQQVVIYVTK